MPQDSPATAMKRVRPRRAASLILLRDSAGRLEVLLGRRGRGHRFMPGVFVFPGGRAMREDARPWHGEGDEPAAHLDPLLRRLARAALRETYEETGLVFGRAGAAPAAARDLLPIESAYLRHGVRPALDLLTLVGRAITPSRSPMRFDARFFLADGRFATGDLGTGEELEDVRWHPVGDAPPTPMSGVTRFMLKHAVAVWRGTAEPGIPFYKHILNRYVIARVPVPGAAPAPRRKVG